MDRFSLFDYYKMMQKENMVLSFKGALSHEILVSLAEIIREKLTKLNHKQKTTKKVFAVFIELAQNINYYSAERIQFDNKDVGTGIIVIKENEDYYSIISGNVIKNIELEKIKERINYINSLDKDGLKKYYKEKIKAPREEGQLGGGIGLIDIARKSENPLRYESSNIDDTYSFFVLSVKIVKED